MRRRVLSGVMVVTILIWVVLAGWFLWWLLVPRVISMAVYVSLRTELGQFGYTVNNNSTVSFNMPQNSEGEFSISVINNGTSPLHDVLIKIEQISNDLTLHIGHFGRPAQPSDTIPLSTLIERDSITYAWPLFSPSRPGNYEIIFYVASDEVKYTFKVVIIVS